MCTKNFRFPAVSTIQYTYIHTQLYSEPILAICTRRACMQRPQTGKRMNWTAAAAAGNRDHRHLAAATRQRPLPSHHSPVLVVRLHRAHDSVASHKATRRVRPRHATSYLVLRTHYCKHLWYGGSCTYGRWLARRKAPEPCLADLLHTMLARGSVWLVLCYLH